MEMTCLSYKTSAGHSPSPKIHISSENKETGGLKYSEMLLNKELSRNFLQENGSN